MVAVVGLVAALVGLASWVLVDRLTAGGGAREDATALVDDFNAAVNATDSQAVKALLAKGVVMVSLGDTHRGADAVTNQLTGMTKRGVRVERIAPVNLVGQYASTFDKYTAPGGESGIMLAVFQLRDGKIVRIWGMQPPVTPPYGNEALG